MYVIFLASLQRTMSLLIYLIIVAVVHEETFAGQLLPTNRFGTKNSYSASLELWEDEPIDAQNEYIEAYCQPIQVMSA